jgi:hypothetical protein
LPGVLWMSSRPQWRFDHMLDDGEVEAGVAELA